MRWYLTRKPVNHEATVPNRLTSHRPFHVEWYLYMPLYQVIELQCRRSVEQIKSTRPYESRLVSRIFWTKSSIAVKPRQHLFGLKVLKSVGLSSTFVLNTGWAIWPGNENATGDDDPISSSGHSRCTEEAIPIRCNSKNKSQSEKKQNVEGTILTGGGETLSNIPCCYWHLLTFLPVIDVSTRSYHESYVNK